LDSPLESELEVLYNLLSKNVKIRIYKTAILPVVLYGYGIWLSNIKGGTQRVFENRVLR
jgi:hypothetical protein